MLAPRFLAALPLFLATLPAHAQDGAGIGGKLLLTNGISTIEGASGGGLTPWAVIAGNETRDGVGVQGAVTAAELKDYDFRAYSIAIGIRDRVEISIARQSFNTNEIGGALGLGTDYAFDQDVLGAKVKLFGDAVYGLEMLPAIAVGVEYKHSRNGAIVKAIGARHAAGADLYASVTKLFLSRSVLLNLTGRLTKANQTGLLGFGGIDDAYRFRLEASAAYQVSRRLVIGGEFRAKPDNMAIAHEGNWFDGFVAFAVNRHVTLTAAYTDLGSIATIRGQRGGLIQLQASF